MNKLQIEIPKPSQYVSHKQVEEIATEMNKRYRVELNHPNGHIVDVMRFIDECLRINIIWEEIEEPPNRICFARLHQEDGEHTITVNEKHRALFEAKPELLRSCLSHEVGHYILRHLENSSPTEEQNSLFEVEKQTTKYFHDSTWSQQGLSHQDFLKLKNDLAKTAWNNEKDRELLNHLEDRLELKWMYYQAEQFSSCFLVPQDKLYEYLNEGLDITKWPSLYALKDKFGVSISMIKVRLEKLGTIKVENKVITLVQSPTQEKMWL